MYNGALISGSMSGFCTYTPKSEEKQHKDDYPCNGLLGVWSHDQLIKIVKNKSCSTAL